MEYTISSLANLAGISTRTLRWYDECGLLQPKSIKENGYRVYGKEEVNKLQLILFYKEMGVELSKIKQILNNNDFNTQIALENHLKTLLDKRDLLDKIILNVEKTIKEKKGEIIMKDEEKFEGFKDKLIKDNEEKYGKEVREKYGDAKVEESNARLKGITKEQYEKGEQILNEFEKTLEQAFNQGNPASETAQKAAALHKDWLCVFAPCYNKEYHKALGEMYVQDERFRANYDKFGKGCTEFLRDAINIFCEN